jgi:hypothetical protein
MVRGIHLHLPAEGTQPRTAKGSLSDEYVEAEVLAVL